MNTTEIIRQIRPETRPLDQGWSTNTLDQILASEPERRRPVGWIAACVGVSVFATAGVAYAGGWIPDFVSDGFENVSISHVTNERQIADLTLPDGRRVGIWLADEGQGTNCLAVSHDWDGSDGSQASSYSCGKIVPTEGFFWSSATFRSEDQAPQPFLIAYGERPSQAVVAVHLVGDNIDITTSLDESAVGFGIVIPGAGRAAGSLDDGITAEFLNREGELVSKTELSGL